MNIKDLQPNSYQVVAPKSLNIKDLKAGSFQNVNQQPLGQLQQKTPLIEKSKGLGFGIGLGVAPIGLGGVSSFLGRAGEKVKEAGKERDVVTKARKEGKQGLIETGIQHLGGILGLGFDIASEAPIIKQGFEMFGKGVGALSETAPIKKAGEVISPATGFALGQYEKLSPERKRTVGALGEIASTIPFGAPAKTAKVVSKVTKPLEKGLGKLAGEASKTTKTGISKIIPESSSSDIMNRVARLKPTDASKFEKLAGKSHGEYLTETGNFGAPDVILKKEADKFITSKTSVDTELAKLKGTFKEGSVKDALDELVEKAKSVSSENVKAPYLEEALTLQNKYNKSGLTMSEINQVKRLYEGKVKLGYNKLMNADKVEKATNIDNALRKWQSKRAEDLGFKNIKELNKQTQLSKFMIDKLGDQVIGKSGLNGISLTDWIVLSGGSGASLSGFLTKKFFSSKSVQSKIAEILNKSDIQGLIKPKITQ